MLSGWYGLQWFLGIQFAQMMAFASQCLGIRLLFFGLCAFPQRHCLADDNKRPACSAPSRQSAANGISASTTRRRELKIGRGHHAVLLSSHLHWSPLRQWTKKIHHYNKQPVCPWLLQKHRLLSGNCFDILTKPKQGQISTFQAVN